MKKFIISEEEKSRILSLHEGLKKGLMNEQTTGTTTGTTVSGQTASNTTSKTKSQKSIEWGKDVVNGAATSKQYSVTITNMQRSPGEKPVTFNMYITLQKSSNKSGSWLGYYMRIYDGKTKKMVEGVSIDCNTVDTNLKSSSWTQIDVFNSSDFKWYFNKEFLQDLKQTLGCK
jgi:hypothetical protein